MQVKCPERVRLLRQGISGAAQARTKPPPASGARRRRPAPTSSSVGRAGRPVEVAAASQCAHVDSGGRTSHRKIRAPPTRGSSARSPRVRALSLMGLHELTSALGREEARLGARRDADDLDAADAATLQAAYERTEWAKAELANESPHGNAQAFISMNSETRRDGRGAGQALAYVHVERIGSEIMAKGREAAGDAVEKVDARSSRWWSTSSDEKQTASCRRP